MAGSSRPDLETLRAIHARHAAAIPFENLAAFMGEPVSLDLQAIQDKLQNAQIAENFETEQGGERFTLIRAPAPAKLPVFPNRIGLILLGVVLAAFLAARAVGCEFKLVKVHQRVKELLDMTHLASVLEDGVLP